MADTSIFASPSNISDNKEALWGTFYADVSNGVAIGVDGASDLQKIVTANGGTSATNADIVEGAVKKVAAYFDKAVPGDTGDLVHVAWVDGVDNALYYVTVDASDGTVGTIRTVDDTITVDSVERNNRVGITKTKSGNIIIVGSTQTEIFAYKSSDNFATAGTSIANPMETATEEDHVRLFPADTADSNDAAAVFWDRSADEISVKMYDDSADTWTESSVGTSMADNQTRVNMAGAVRHSDGNLLLAAWNAYDTTTADLQTWDIAVNSISSPTVTAKTNVVTDSAESAFVNMIIDQQTDDVYVAYCKGGTLLDSVDVVYKKSTDGMATWGTEQAYSENTADDVRFLGGTSSVTDAGGRIQWAFYNDDTTDIFVNLTNDIEISAASGSHSLTALDIESTTSVASPALSQAHKLTASAIEATTVVGSPAITQRHVLTAADTETTAEIQAPVLSQVHKLTALDIEAQTSIGAPSMGGTVQLTALDIEALTNIGSPALSQQHVLHAYGITAQTAIGAPVLSQVHRLTALDIEARTAVGVATIPGAGDPEKAVFTYIINLDEGKEFGVSMDGPKSFDVVLDPDGLDIKISL